MQNQTWEEVDKEEQQGNRTHRQLDRDREKAEGEGFQRGGGRERGGGERKGEREGGREKGGERERRGREGGEIVAEG